MVTHAKPDYALMPDVYLQRGITYSLQKKTGEALNDLQKAIELNPKMFRAYIALADLYEDVKQPDKALAAVTEGLRHAPGSKALQRRYKELGGKQPFPTPYAAPEPKPEAKPEDAETPATKPEDGLDPAAIRAKREAEPKQPSSTPAATPSTPIGSSRNPWCRFCAEEDAVPNTTAPSTPAAEPKAAP